MNTNPVVTMKFRDYETPVIIELFPEYAPNTVNNFIHLANKGFYDTLMFHRVIDGFMIQGGDPTGFGTGGPGYSIKGEFNSNGFNNPLRHTEGVISMARTSDSNSAGSQFFIMLDDTPNLDNDYAAFGKVISGMDVIHKVGSTPVDRNDRPITVQFIDTVSVDTKGVVYPKPEKYKKLSFTGR